MATILGPRALYYELMVIMTVPKKWCDEIWKYLTKWTTLPQQQLQRHTSRFRSGKIVAGRNQDHGSTDSPNFTANHCFHACHGVSHSRCARPKCIKEQIVPKSFVQSIKLTHIDHWNHWISFANQVRLLLQSGAPLVWLHYFPCATLSDTSSILLRIQIRESCFASMVFFSLDPWGLQTPSSSQLWKPNDFLIMNQWMYLDHAYAESFHPRFSWTPRQWDPDPQNCCGSGLQMFPVVVGGLRWWQPQYQSIRTKHAVNTDMD